MNRLGFILMCGVAGCSSTSSDQRDTLRDAASIHNEMIELANQIANELETIAIDSAVESDTIESIKLALENWKLDLVEVPGNEEVENHEGHHHGHDYLELTPDQMLTIQVELMKKLNDIDRRVNKLKSK